ncbi:MAG: hypothetical protein A3H02_02870 [Candidatus Niyogibacteria bacterium RIFCSPLOWO2_12_FULL_41_13]|uniref:Uncharacterized protein n=1 Tax=Candidatus Niyogibacteria bacterium RIFCSPLOWO2_12_FULL_41_13 TaxID=1801726 RepID=A0A1G2F3A0_9BACT|nr:MAG: hypothetical protein A3H02_02870 [Candidatus Niyogibacteria bacterium RIFCSPLOWO2_12_FULL_41_13]
MQTSNFIKIDICARRRFFFPLEIYLWTYRESNSGLGNVPIILVDPRWTRGESNSCLGNLPR